MYGFEHFGMGLGGLGMLLIWLVPIVLVFALLRYFTDDGRRRRDDKALDVLDQRYAKGEIGREEYLSRRADLGR